MIVSVLSISAYNTAIHLTQFTIPIISSALSSSIHSSLILFNHSFYLHSLQSSIPPSLSKSISPSLSSSILSSLTLLVHFSFTNTQSHLFPLLIPYLLVHSPPGLVSLVGNGSIMVMFCRRLRHLTAAEVLLLNLAVMHLCLAVFSYPAPTMSSFAHRWLFGNVGECVGGWGGGMEDMCGIFINVIPVYILSFYVVVFLYFSCSFFLFLCLRVSFAV